jgi:hypothetical protein
MIAIKIGSTSGEVCEYTVNRESTVGAFIAENSLQPKDTQSFLIYKGKKLDHSDTFSDILDGSKLIIYHKTSVAPTVAPSSPPSTTPSTPSTPVVAPKRYTGEMLKIAIAKDPSVLLYIAHIYALRDPFTLSQIAVNITQYQSHLKELLDDPNFVIQIENPVNQIELALNRPFYAQSQFEIDENNVRALMKLLAIPESQFSRVKEIYLFNDRNIGKIIGLLRPQQ